MKTKNSMVRGLPVIIKQEIAVTICDLTRVFSDEEKAEAWVSETMRELEVYENLGILTLVSSDDPRWGNNGFGHPGWARMQDGGKGFIGLLERARTYVTFVLLHQDTRAYDGMAYNEWIPIHCKQELLSVGITGERR